LRRDFSSSSLVGLLGELALLETETSKQDFAERLGQWLGVFEGMTLHAAHQASQACEPAKPSAARPAAKPGLTDEFQRVRTTLVKAIQASTAASAKNQGLISDAPTQASAEDAPYAPHHQRYLQQQRTMGLKIEVLRAQARQAMSPRSPRLAELARFDAVMEQMLGGREHKLLASVPALLERRFEHLRASGQPGWPERFGKDLQRILLAELEVRLQPVMGLIEALSNEVKKYP
jgi:hypothetical protein